MNYIILDLEWDSTYFKKQNRFINQILQIGAVKLNESFDVIDSIDLTIKSSISKRVTSRFAKLTGITSQIMREGIPFELAVEEYNNWVGNDTVTMTWSDSDLYTIIENEENILNGVRFKIEKYLDLQKFIQGEMRLSGYDNKNQISLEAASEILKIDTKDIEFHNAKDDSLVSALLLKKCYNEDRFNALVKDTTNPEFFKRLKFKSYAIANLNDKDIDKKNLEFCCEKCGNKANRVSKWKYSNRWFMANFICDCGERFNGRVTFKKTYDDVIVRKKICEFREKKRKENEVQPVPEKL